MSIKLKAAITAVAIAGLAAACVTEYLPLGTMSGQLSLNRFTARTNSGATLTATLTMPSTGFPESGFWGGAGAPTPSGSATPMPNETDDVYPFVGFAVYPFAAVDSGSYNFGALAVGTPTWAAKGTSRPYLPQIGTEKLDPWDVYAYFNYLGLGYYYGGYYGGYGPYGNLGTYTCESFGRIYWQAIDMGGLDAAGIFLRDDGGAGRGTSFAYAPGFGAGPAPVGSILNVSNTISYSGIGDTALLHVLGVTGRWIDENGDGDFDYGDNLYCDGYSLSTFTAVGGSGLPKSIDRWDADFLEIDGVETGKGGFAEAIAAAQKAVADAGLNNIQK